MTRTFAMIAAALVLAAVAAAGAFLPRGSDSVGQTLLPPMAAQAQTADAALPAVEDMVLGQADAPVTVMEYGSYTCPHCATFHEQNFARLKAEYIDTGKVRFVFREVYFDRYGLWAAMVARCGGPTRYFGIHSILYDKQQEWAGSDDPNAVVSNLIQIGKAAGMDQATLDACMQDANKAQAMINAFEANMAADGVEGTPTVFINGARHGNMGWADLKALIDAELAKG
jgi:protein-disulfide isomerase